MEAYLLLGSNLGDRKHQIEKSIQLIAEQIGLVLKESSIYETESWGISDQPIFLNKVILVETSFDPFELLKCIKNIEISMGRKERAKWHNREIDIDILFYGKQYIETPELRIPHPYLHERMFTLVPLMEIDPFLNHPTLNRSIEDLYDLCRDEGNVMQIEEE